MPTASEIEVINADALEILSSIPSDTNLIGTSDGAVVNLPVSVIEAIFASIASLSLKADQSLVVALQSSINALTYRFNNLPKFYKWLNGEGVPTGALGVDGQYYLNTLTGDIYTKVPGSWVFVMTIGGSLEGTLPDYLNLNQKGFTITATSGESVVDGEICYLKSDGKFWKTACTAEGSIAGELAMAIESIAPDASGTFLRYGLHPESGMALAAPYYISSTPGGKQTSKVFPQGSFIRQVGYGHPGGFFFFDPEKEYHGESFMQI